MLSNLPQEILKRRENDRMPYNMVYRPETGQVNRILWNYRNMILDAWDTYKRRLLSDQRPYSWILNIFYFNKLELVVSYYDWLHSQNIDIPSHQIMYH